MHFQDKSVCVLRFNNAIIRMKVSNYYDKNSACNAAWKLRKPSFGKGRTRYRLYPWAIIQPVSVSTFVSMLTTWTLIFYAHSKCKGSSVSNDLDLRSSPRFDIRCMACFIGALRRYLYALAQGVPDDYSFLLVIKSNFSRSLKVKEDTDQLDCGCWLLDALTRIQLWNHFLKSSQGTLEKEPGLRRC